MNKKFTLLAAALMTVGTFTAASAASDVPSKEWTVGNYYYLKTTDDSYLALDGTKADSVIVKKFVSSDVTKAAIDSALWQISDKQTTLGVTTYKLTNKVTQQVLSFAAKANANTNLALGVDRWVLSENGSTIKGFYDGDKTLELVVTEGKLSLTTGGGTTFNVKAPESAFPLNAQQLGNGFSVFQLKFGDIYDGNIFAGKDLLAKDITGKAGYVTLQAKGDESYANGVAKYFGVDTLKSTISGARDVFGYKFALDSTRTNVKPNEACQQFKFTIDLKNDS